MHRRLRIILGVFFVTTGVLHFSATNFLARMMPDYVPLPFLAIYLSGVLEICLGLALAIGRAVKTCRFLLIILLVAVFPANINMALHPELFPDLPTWLAWARLPLQFVFIYLVILATRAPLAVPENT